MTVSTSDDKAASRRRGDEPMDRVLHALSHPVRRWILRSLVDEDGSASTISKKLDLNLGVVSYHLNQVLARECEVVELVETIQRRGALEKIYALKFDALAGASARRSNSRSGMRPMSAEESFIVAAVALDEGAFTKLSKSGWEWSLAQVDGLGWEEICAAREEFDRRIQVAVESSQGRSSADGPHDVVVGAAAFPAVSPSPSNS
jgi:DNA-binding transcriptional ArsR family regulator